ncbi:hypothetical protein [Cobetia sp. ICG0124]|uniref:hypothetical protein n=1 Tax=Cobetia sp. ICG0124 TaxID=2053669 RepID=UPI000FD8A215|nr:hypothetical protein [Cobetia sp. ICG0124]AZV31793.1 hypothetical protein CU110_11065 [Cobetia sp. ICG0124]
MRRLGTNQGHVLGTQQQALLGTLDLQQALEVPATHRGMGDAVAVALHLQRYGFPGTAAPRMKLYLFQQHQTIEVLGLKDLVAFMHAHREGVVVAGQFTSLVVDAARPFQDTHATDVQQFAVDLLDDKHLDVALLEQLITQ